MTWVIIRVTWVFTCWLKNSCSFWAWSWHSWSSGGPAGPCPGCLDCYQTTELFGTASSGLTPPSPPVCSRSGCSHTLSFYFSPRCCSFLSSPFPGPVGTLSRSSWPHSQCRATEIFLCHQLVPHAEFSYSFRWSFENHGFLPIQWLFVSAYSCSHSLLWCDGWEYPSCSWAFICSEQSAAVSAYAANLAVASSNLRLVPSGRCLPTNCQNHGGYMACDLERGMTCG